MSFGYQQVTISGSDPAKEGTIEFIRELKDYMEGVGWTTADDRTDQSGSGAAKLVMQSNGEEGGYPTFYMIVTSGTSAAAGSNYTQFQMCNAYDVPNHEIPTSGVVSQAFDIQMAGLNSRSADDFEAWMSGDSEALTLVTRQGADTYDSMMVGRANSFMSLEDNPFPLYVFAVASPNPFVWTSDTTGQSSRGVGGNPPTAFDDSNDLRMLHYINLDGLNQPYSIGSAESIFLAAPILMVYSDFTTRRQGICGTVRNAWDTSGSASGLVDESVLTASGTSGVQTYKAFQGNDTQSGLIMRRT